jgi:hypothetical protein
MILVTAALLAWDVIAATNATRGDTISEQLTGAAHRWPILPFALGVLVGHWFWR